VICSRCGHDNPGDANFCSSCGTAISTTPDTTITFLPVEQHSDQLDSGPDPEVPGAIGAGMLVVRFGADAGASFILQSDSTSVGRHVDSDIFLDDFTVSRNHAQIRRDAEGYTVVDSGSLNGTYVNRQRIDSVRLKAGDELQIGKFRLQYVPAADE
jgi:pSer/pThr/pTyr-binding forkhead associated (FHA) protein